MKQCFLSITHHSFSILLKSLTYEFKAIGRTVHSEHGHTHTHMGDNISNHSLKFEIAIF
jgi:hypothetical protein